MSEQEQQNPQHDPPPGGGLAERGLDVWRAGLGAWASAEEEGSKLFGQLVRRGEAYEARRREEAAAAADELRAQRAMAAEQIGRAVSGVGAVAGQAEQLASSVIGRMMHQVNLPTRSEVDALARKIDRLAAQVDRLTEVIERRQTPS